MNDPIVEPPLHEAVRRADLKRVGELIARGADINERGAHGSTPLIEAVSTRSVELVELLLKAGADPNLRAADGRTALGEARTKPREKWVGSLWFKWETAADPGDPLVRLLTAAGAE
jgi:hypothetical protein